MPAHGQKGKGKRRRKADKPYDRPKGFITKVKDLLNPWSWSKHPDTHDPPVAEDNTSSDSDMFESAPSSPVDGWGDHPVGSGDTEHPALTPSVPQYRPSDDPRYTSFKSKADIGNLTVDILSDRRVESIFGNMKSDITVQHPRSFGDTSSQALMPADMSTRATAGSDSSSQASISEVDPNETGNVSLVVGGAIAKGNKMAGSSSSSKYLSTSLAIGNRGRLSLFTPHSSLQSLRERQGTSHRRSLLATSSLSANLFTSTPRVDEERRSHQVATPLSVLHAPRSSVEGSTGQANNADAEEIFEQEAPPASLPSFVTPTRKRTSLSRTPFNSPFYQSGRTPYFSGAGQQKRGRPESPSSPELPPLCQKATARPLASSSATTQTAKKILQALESISSPLENVRRLPPRLPVQPSAKRRKAEFLDPLAPPTDPLQSAVPVKLLPPLSTTSLFSAEPLNRQRNVPSTGLASQPSKLPSSIPFSEASQPSLTGSNPPTVFAGSSPPNLLTGSSPPIVPMLQPSQSNRRCGLTGKMISPRRRHMDEQFSPLDNNNPLELPPPIPLLGLKSAPKLNIATSQTFTQSSVTSTKDSQKTVSLSSSLSLPSSLLGAPLPLSTAEEARGTYLQPASSSACLGKPPFQMVPTTAKATPPVSAHKASSLDSHVTPPKATFSLSVGGAYTFAPPTQMSPARVSTDNFNKPFIFSPPQVRVGVSAQSTTPLLPVANKGTPPQLPQSALDALKKLKEAGEKMAAEEEAGNSSSPEVVDLSGDDEAKEKTAVSVSPQKAGKEEQKSLAFKPLTHLAPPTDSWSCDTCLVNNKEEDVKCCACGADKPGGAKDSTHSSLAAKPLTTLSVPAVSWTCDMCLVPNKEDADQCVCCGAKKPGSGPSKLSAPLKLPTPSDSGEGDGWTCDTCLVPNKSSDGKCVCCGGNRPGEKADSKAASNVEPGPGGGLKLNFPAPTSSSGGLKLNFPAPTSSSGGLKLNFPVPTSSSGGLKLNFPAPTSSSGGLKLNFPAPTSSSGGLKLNFPAPTSSSGGLKLNFPVPTSSAVAGGLKLNFPISKDDTNTIPPVTEGAKLAPGETGPALKFSMAASGTSTSTSGEVKVSPGGLKLTGGLGPFSSSGQSEPEKGVSSGSVGVQKSVTFKLDEDAQGTAIGQKGMGEDSDGGSSASNSMNDRPILNADVGLGIGMKVGGFGVFSMTSGAKLAGVQEDKGQSEGGLKPSEVAMTTPATSVKLGGELDGTSNSTKLGGVTMATSGPDGGLKLGGAAVPSSVLSGGLKLGNGAPAGSAFGSINLTFSNTSNDTSGGGVQLGGDLKLKPLPPLPVTLATSSVPAVSKETSGGVPALSGLGSGGSTFGFEGAQQSNTAGFSLGGFDGLKGGMLSSAAPPKEAKSTASGLIFGGLKEGGTEQTATASPSTGLQVPSFLSPFQKEESNLFAASLKGGSNSEQKPLNSSTFTTPALSSGGLTLGGSAGLFTPATNPLLATHGGATPQLALSSLSATSTTTATSLSGAAQRGDLFFQPPGGLQLSQKVGAFTLPASKPLQGVSAGAVGVTTAPFQFGGQASGGTGLGNPFGSALAPTSQQNQPLTSATLNFFGQQSTANAQQASSGGFAGGLALGGQKTPGGGGGGGMFSGLQGPSAPAPLTTAGTSPAFNFGTANLTPNFAFGSGNMNPNVPQSENPFLSHKSPSQMLNFTSPPTNTETGVNVFSAAAAKNSRIVKKAVRRGKR